MTVYCVPTRSTDQSDGTYIPVVYTFNSLNESTNFYRRSSSMTEIQHYDNDGECFDITDVETDPVCVCNSLNDVIQCFDRNYEIRNTDGSIVSSTDHHDDYYNQCW